MKRKSIVALLLAGCMLFTAGCGANGKGTKGISNKYVKISQYKGIEVEKEEAQKVTDEEVNNYIESVLNQQTKEVTDRPLKEGDIAQVDYKGKLKSTGEVFDEGTLSIGNGETYVEGFEEGLYGHKLNETFDIEVTFPEGYGGESKPELSNADVIFTVTITSIQERVESELTDELVKKISEKSDTVDEYKKEVRKTLEESNEQTAEGTMTQDAWNAVMDNVKVVKYPEDELKAKEKQLDEQMKMILEQSYQIEFEDYLEQAGITEEEYNKQITEMAKEYLKQNLTIEAIAKEEGLELSDKEYKKEIKAFAKENGYSDEKTMLETLGEDQVKEAILQNKVMEWIVDNSKFVKAKQEDTSTKNTEEKTAE